MELYRKRPLSKTRPFPIKTKAPPPPKKTKTKAKTPRELADNAYSQRQPASDTYAREVSPPAGQLQPAAPIAAPPARGNAPQEQLQPAAPPAKAAPPHDPLEEFFLEAENRNKNKNKRKSAETPWHEDCHIPKPNQKFLKEQLAQDKDARIKASAEVAVFNAEMNLATSSGEASDGMSQVFASEPSACRESPRTLDYCRWPSECPESPRTPGGRRRNRSPSSPAPPPKRPSPSSPTERPVPSEEPAPTSPVGGELEEPAW